MKKLLAALTALALLLQPTSVLAAEKDSPTKGEKTTETTSSSTGGCDASGATIVGRMADGTVAYYGAAPDCARGYILVKKVSDPAAEAAARNANPGFTNVATFDVTTDLNPASVEIDITVDAGVASGNAVKVIHVQGGNQRNDYAGHSTGYVTFHISRGEGLSPFVVLTNGRASGANGNLLPNTDTK